MFYTLVTMPTNSPDTSSLTFQVRGLDCAEEVALLKRAVGPVAGGEDLLAFDLIRGTLTVRAGAAEAEPEALLRAIATTGMRGHLLGTDAPAPRANAWADRSLIVATTAACGGVLVGLLLHATASGWHEALTGSGAAPTAAIAAYGVGIVLGGLHIARKAMTAIRFARPDMYLLMSGAVIGAVLLGEYFEAGTVTALFSFSLLLEAWSVDRARRSVAALMELAPETARVRCPNDGCLSEKPVDAVQPGACIVIKPGERVPLDARIVRGETLVDQSPITGESIPEPRGPGDSILAGTINQTGLVEAEVTESAGETLLARMLRMIEEARGRKAAAEQWVEVFARYYTPVVLGIALAIMLLPPLLQFGGFADWFYRGLVVLVIGCPCALVISTPVAMVAGLTRAARSGVLIKGGAYLDTAAQLKAIAFDKTGTLTLGRPEVVDVVLLEGSRGDVLRVALALEQGAHHPMASAILEAARREDIEAVEIEGHTADHGRGVRGTLDGESCWLGSAAMPEVAGAMRKPLDDILQRAAAGGRTPVVVGCGAQVLGVIALQDQPRPQARETLARLRALGIDHLGMVTGDRQAVADALAGTLGITDVLAECLPEGKVDAVRELADRYGTVAMVGDGVNDAPALAASSLGIAMGAAGSDAALETADIALMRDDLRRLPWLVEHARRVRRVVQQNIAFALGIKALFLLLAALGSATLWMAIAADMGTSLLVVFNALRLLWRR
ncbi:MAG: heavy metal translocating P-type ATPase [Candidatus Hydrogenedens sp.]|nr:heavy metal translocating P-type ATPase [Candidatus Hydrogenedens sp.]